MLCLLAPFCIVWVRKTRKYVRLPTYFRIRNKDSCCSLSESTVKPTFPRYQAHLPGQSLSWRMAPAMRHHVGCCFPNILLLSSFFFWEPKGKSDPIKHKNSMALKTRAIYYISNGLAEGEAAWTFYSSASNLRGFCPVLKAIAQHRAVLVPSISSIFQREPEHLVLCHTNGLVSTEVSSTLAGRSYGGRMGRELPSSHP